MAFSVDDQTLNSLKKATIAMVHKTLSDFSFDEMSFKDTFFIDKMQIGHLKIHEKNIKLQIEGDKLIYTATNFQFQLDGHMSHKNWRGQRSDGTDFYMRLKPRSVIMRLEFVMDHQFVDYQTLPFLTLDSSHFELNSDHIDIDLISDNVLMKMYASFIKTFKTPVVYSTQVAMNLGFTTLFNS